MLLHILLFLFLYCHWLAVSGKIKYLLCVIIVYSFLLSIEIFHEYFFALSPVFHLNVIVFMCVIIYNTIQLSLYYILAHKKGLGGVIYATISTAISGLHIAPPLNPVILYYKYNVFFLPNTSYPVINLYLINILIALCFIVGLRLMFILLCGYLFVFFLPVRGSDSEKMPAKNIGIIQVGLYYRNGGTPEHFYDDLVQFIKNNDIDIVIFSENVYFGSKNNFIQKNTDNLLSRIRSDNEINEHAFLFNFYGYKDINNVVSVFMKKDEVQVHQKMALIPFIEQRYFFNYPESLSSDYVQIDNNIKNSNYFTLNNTKINVHICYEALFPEIKEYKGISVVQSDYIKLNRGRDYQATIINGSLLAKFSVAPNIPLINIQNYGGTVILSNDWRINKDFYKRSEKEPFLVVRL
ncbi:TPA: apolipoprotein acyltransferase [Escherichia coli]|nr:apolipoprotein acyltransferase [Escherichia coli]